MLTGEEVDSWNQLFPDCQINNTNLGNPTEGFLTKALVCYLRRFGYRVEPPFDLDSETRENNKETRSFLIKLTRQIDHFLKITDKNYSFTYYDLIRPTPKKTAHMLYILLNYYYYYNLYKEDVFKMASDSIRSLNEVKGCIDKTRSDNKRRKEDNINMKSTIENLREDVPKARAKLRELDESRSQQEDECDKLDNLLHELKERSKHLEEQKKTLRKRVVGQEEFQELQNQLQQLTSNLEEREQTEQSNIANLNECKESNEHLQNLIKRVEKSHNILPLAGIKELKATNDLLAQSIKEEQELISTHKSMSKALEEENANFLSLKKSHRTQTQDFQTKERDLTSTIREKESILKRENNRIAQLETEDHISECQLEEQKDIAQYLLENLSEILGGHTE